MVSALGDPEHPDPGGQVKTDDKFNEMTAIPRLLELFGLNGCIANIDNMGCHRMIVPQISKPRRRFQSVGPSIPFADVSAPPGAKDRPPQIRPTGDTHQLVENARRAR